MAVMECPNCGKEISDKSEKCVYCGLTPQMSDLNEKKSRIKKKNNVYIILIELVIIVISIILYINLFGKRIKNYIDDGRKQRLEKTCVDQYSGIWDKDNKVCKTEGGDITIN